MKKFKFSLQFYLNLKIKQKKLAYAEVYAALARLEALKERRKSLALRLKEGQEILAQRLKEGLSPRHALDFYRHFGALNDMIRATDREIAEAELDLARAQQKVITLNREVDILEKLRRRKYEEYLKDTEREAAKEIDTLFSFRLASGDS